MLTSAGRWVFALMMMALVLGVVVRYAMLIAFASGLLVILGAGMVSLMRRSSLVARQTIDPPMVEAGSRGSARLEVENRGHRRSPLMLAVNLIGQEEVHLDVPSLSPGGRFVESMDLPTSSRGVFEVGPLSIDQTDPFGLVRATRNRGGAAKLIVHPVVHDMAVLPTGRRRELEGSSVEQPLEGGISFHSLRDYEQGDDLRLIHWRSVAKTGTLMVRKNIVTTEPRLMVILDTWAGSYSHDAFEDAVSLAASLVVSGSNSNYPMMLRTTGGLSADVTGAGAGLPEALCLLANVGTSDDDPSLNGLLRFAERVEGVSLGAVTGQPTAERTQGITRAHSRFDMVTVIQVGELHGRPPMRIPGALVLNGADSVDIVNRWRARFR